MGWCYGSAVVEKVSKVVLKVSDLELREEIYKSLVKALRDCDWDTEEEVRGIDPILDKVLEEED